MKLFRIRTFTIPGFRKKTIRDDQVNITRTIVFSKWFQRHLRIMAFIPNAIFCFLIAPFISCNSNNQTISPQRKDLIEAVYASGNLVPYNEYKVFALTDGYLKEKLVSEGDTVAAGQLMFGLEGDQQDLKTNYAREIYSQAKENVETDSPVLQELLAQLNSAKLRRDNDSINYSRYKNLYETESTSKADYDKMKLAYHVSSSDYFALKERIEKTRKQLKLDLQNAQSQYLINSIDKDRYQIKSILNGMVYEIYKDKGELVKRGETIALIGDRNRMYINLLVDEQDIDKIRTGQDVEVKIDAYRDKIFKARVSKIYPMEKKLEQSFRVDADFTEPLEIKSGLSAEANIIIQQKKNALVIPKAFVFGNDSVTMANGTKMKIIKGIEDFDHVEVLGGIDEHAELIKRK